MASDEMEVSKAGPADLAADMEHHRATYARFFKIIVYSVALLAALLITLFVTLKESGSFPVS